MKEIKFESTPLRLYDYEIICGSSEEKEFPERFSLSERVTVKDQKDTGACLACVLASVAEYIWGEEMSEAFNYSMFRDDADKNPGLYLTKALDYARKIGFVPYGDFGVLQEMPDIRNLVKKFPELIGLAQKHTISGYANLLYANRERRDKAIKDALTRDKIGLVAVSNDYFREPHAIMLTGWNDEKDMYKFQNSWGRAYGNDGIGEIPKEEINAVCAVFIEPVKLPFEDVPADSWYHNSIKNVYLSGLMNGASETAFEPDRPITRGEFAAVIDRLCSKTEDNDARIYKVLNELMDR